MGSGSSKGANDPLVLLTYAPAKSARFAYCSSHRVYTNDALRAGRLPTPRPPPCGKRQIFNPKAYAHVDKRIKELTADLNRPIAELVHELTSCYDDDEVAKVRALYQWLTSQPIETSQYVKVRGASTMYQLWHLKHKQINYADLFSILCWFAGLPCVIIRGHLKGCTYEVGQKMSRDKHVGEWNAVLIGGHWRFIDTFWGACVVTSKGEKGEVEEYSYTPDENYFLTDPENLIFSHFPDEAFWQLLKDRKSVEEFESLAVVKERFFSFRMELLTHFENTVEATDGKVAIYFILHPSKSSAQSFLCLPTYIADSEDEISNTENKNNIAGADSSNLHELSSPFVQTDERRRKHVRIPRENVVLAVKQNGKRKELAVHVKFPRKGVYKLEILGKDREKRQTGYDYDWVAVYKVIVNSVPDESEPSKPRLEADGYGPGENLKHLGLAGGNHLKGVIQTHPGPLKVEFQVLDAGKFNNEGVTAKLIPAKKMENIVVSSAPFKLSESSLNTAIDVKEGVFKLIVMYKPADDGPEITICKYHVISVPLPPTPKTSPDIPPVEAPPPADPTPPPVIAVHVEEPPVQTKVIDVAAKVGIEDLRKRLTDGVAAEDIAALEAAVEETEARRITKELQTEYWTAKDMLVKLHRLRKAISAVMKLDQRSFAEIKSYAHPIPQIHRVMQATLMLLGHTEAETQSWRSVQVLIGKTGKLSIKRRIKELDISDLDGDLAQRSRSMMAGIELPDIVQYSVGVATFYSWSTEVAEQAKKQQ